MQFQQKAVTAAGVSSLRGESLGGEMVTSAGPSVLLVANGGSPACKV